MNKIKNQSELIKKKFDNLFTKKDIILNKSSDFDLMPEINRQVRDLVPAAVLLPILINKGQPKVILTKRAKNLNLHPGQISFPGGKKERSDASELATALRETHEEIGLKPSEIDIIGILPKHETVSGFLINPFVGLVESLASLSANPKEVEEIFEVPLDFLVDRNHMLVQRRIYKAKERLYYTIPYGPYYIWGATAMIIKTFADRVRE